MSLKTYRGKRDFTKTAEPKAGKSVGKGALVFVIQKHAASHLHYDFRLEIDGVLKSWAVPKGPSLDPSIKRLAVQVEDHPFEYRTFEGVIPEGEYGGGTVIIWDEGTYEPSEKSFATKKEQENYLLKEWKAGSLKITLHGKKLQGDFALFHTKGLGENSWLLIKHRDEYASKVDIEQEDKSVKSGKTVEEVSNMKTKSIISLEGETQTVKVDGHAVKLTNLSKIYWPEEAISKRDMLQYYDQVAEYILPYLQDRPQSLNRFPDGIHGASFYQKDVQGKAPSWLKTFPYATREGEKKEYVVGTGEATLLWMASLGCIEMNPWFSRIMTPDFPDYCVIDLDPDKTNSFDQVIQAALEVKRVLDEIDVPAFCKTSGSTGMHIYIPLGAKITYDQSQLFAKLIVTIVQERLPEFTSLERVVKKRSGKMYLDFLQNRPGATIACPYSLRPKLGATVSMPLFWEEVKPGLKTQDFTIKNAVQRARKEGDPFKEVLGEGIDLAQIVEKTKRLFPVEE